MGLAAATACADEGPIPLVAGSDASNGPYDLCTPGSRGCPTVHQPGVCNEEGDAWLDDGAPCAAGTLCAAHGECQEPTCQPGTKACASESRLVVCSDNGTAWQTATVCSGDTACVQGKCVLKLCLQQVLLMIDRSGSMAGAWDIVESSVVDLIEGNPAARFGALGFPSDGACGVDLEPDVPMATYATKQMKTFFSKPPSGSTPLRFALATVAEEAPAIWGEEGGVLVVLSDGGETCAPDGNLLGHLGSLTAELRDVHGVQTWVIGYDFEGDAAQLDAIAAEGGTGETQHLPAGDEDELKDAFRRVVEDWKLCF